MISALVLAAGLARRMGTNKLLLPFGERSILAQVILVLQECLPGEVVVVTGHEHEKVEEAIGRHSAGSLRFVYNPHYAAGEMLSSIQTGLAAMRNDCQAALIALGDQPQIERRIVEQVVAAHEPGAVVIPSFNRRGGHPILIDRACWAEVLALPQGASLREALRAHGDWLRYVRVDSESVLRDVDTPEDYRLITPHVPGFPSSSDTSFVIVNLRKAHSPRSGCASKFYNGTLAGDWKSHRMSLRLAVRLRGQRRPCRWTLG